MDYEKAYNEALKRARHALDCDRNGLVKTDTPLIFSMFPELKESEDERIRKALIDFFNRGAKNGEQTNGICDKDILAWLEKQDKSEEKYTVWVGGLEVNSHYLTKKEAIELAKRYKENNCNDVSIELIDC